nr:hypothetical protein, secreted [uncultured archaeon]CBH37669.1 hypothetical secreted protein [uncultured archaeon]CBH39986.1 hypothetical protein, secreted [uncultured archaeon]
MKAKKGKGVKNSVIFVLALLFAAFVLPNIASAGTCNWFTTSGYGVVDITRKFDNSGLYLIGRVQGEGFYLGSQRVYMDSNTTMLSSKEWAHIQSKSGNFSYGNTGKNYKIGAVACESFSDIEYLDTDTSYAMDNSSFSMCTNTYITGKAHFGFAARDPPGGAGGSRGGATVYGSENYWGDFHINHHTVVGSGGDWLGIP